MTAKTAKRKGLPENRRLARRFSNKFLGFAAPKTVASLERLLNKKEKETRISLINILCEHCNLGYELIYSNRYIKHDFGEAIGWLHRVENENETVWFIACQAGKIHDKF